MAECETLCVSPDRIDAIWPHVAPLLDAAANRCGDWTLAALSDCLLNQEMLLWVAWDGAAIRAAAVTELVIVPKGKICRVVVCGGARGLTRADWSRALAPIETYASTEGAIAMRIDGRRGWLRALPLYELQWITLEKRLN